MVTFFLRSCPCVLCRSIKYCHVFRLQHLNVGSCIKLRQVQFFPNGSVLGCFISLVFCSVLTILLQF